MVEAIVGQYFRNPYPKTKLFTKKKDLSTAGKVRFGEASQGQIDMWKNKMTSKKNIEDLDKVWANIVSEDLNKAWYKDYSEKQREELRQHYAKTKEYILLSTASQPIITNPLSESTITANIQWLNASKYVEKGGTGDDEGLEQRYSRIMIYKDRIYNKDLFRLKQAYDNKKAELIASKKTTMLDSAAINALRNTLMYAKTLAELDVAWSDIQKQKDNIDTDGMVSLTRAYNSKKEEFTAQIPKSTIDRWITWIDSAMFIKSKGDEKGDNEGLEDRWAQIVGYKSRITTDDMQKLEKEYTKKHAELAQIEAQKGEQTLVERHITLLQNSRDIPELNENWRGIQSSWSKFSDEEKVKFRKVYETRKKQVEKVVPIIKQSKPEGFTFKMFDFTWQPYAPEDPPSPTAAAVIEEASKALPPSMIKTNKIITNPPKIAYPFYDDKMWNGMSADERGEVLKINYRDMSSADVIALKGRPWIGLPTDIQTGIGVPSSPALKIPSLEGLPGILKEEDINKLISNFGTEIEKIMQEFQFMLPIEKINQTIIEMVNTFTTAFIKQDPYPMYIDVSEPDYSFYRNSALKNVYTFQSGHKKWAIKPLDSVYTKGTIPFTIAHWSAAVQAYGGRDVGKMRMLLPSKAAKNTLDNVSEIIATTNDAFDTITGLLGACSTMGFTKTKEMIDEVVKIAKDIGPKVQQLTEKSIRRVYTYLFDSKTGIMVQFKISVEKFATDLQQYATEFANALSAWGQTVWNRMAKWGTSFQTSLVDWFKSLQGAIQEDINTLYNFIISMTTKISSALQVDMITMQNYLVKSASGLQDNIMGNIKGLITAVDKSMTGNIEDIKKQLTDALDFTKLDMSKMKELFQGDLGTMRTQFQNSITELTKGFKADLQSITSEFRGKYEELLKDVTQLFTDMNTKSGEINNLEKRLKELEAKFSLFTTKAPSKATKSWWQFWGFGDIDSYKIGKEQWYGTV